MPVHFGDYGDASTLDGTELVIALQGERPVLADMSAVGAYALTVSGFAAASYAAAQSINAQTGTEYTVAASDIGKMVTLTNAGAITCTLPADADATIPIGSRIDFAQLGAGQVTFAAGSGATANAQTGLKISAQYGQATAFKRAANTWLVFGDMAA